MWGQLSLCLLQRGESRVLVFVFFHSPPPQLSEAGSLSEWEMGSVLILSSLLVTWSSLINRCVTSTLREAILPPKEEEEMRGWEFYSCCPALQSGTESSLFCGYVRAGINTDLALPFWILL